MPDASPGSPLEMLETARSALKPIFRWIKDRRYLGRLAHGEPAGSFAYHFADQGPPGQLPVTLWCRSDGPNGVSWSEAQTWHDRQTLTELVVVGVDGDGGELWRVPPDDAPSPSDPPFWFAAPGSLPEVLPTHLESCFLVAAAEDVDAVVLLEGGCPDSDVPLTEADHAHEKPHCTRGLYRSDAYSWDVSADEIRPLKNPRLVKLIDPRDGSEPARDSDRFNRLRRGPYLSTTELPQTLMVPVRDAALIERRPRLHPLPAVLVTVPFLARGGAEQTLHATMNQLADRFDFSIATLAPHRETLGDRRDDFRAITDRLFCLGDLVHPDVMLGILESILDTTGAEIIYNANGTTLFYDFAPRLKEKRPNLRIIDHLYDHEIGYIERYDRRLLAAVDACVAENHHIAQALTESRDWPAERVPVIWPCGRADDDLPSPTRRDEIRRSLRKELGFREDDVVFLTAARMHPQKRPLDLVQLAERVRDLEHIHFLVVGGGDLEDRIDEAIAARPGINIRRLAFRMDIPDLIVAADIGCLVSDFEGLPVFMLECLQLGRPFLGTRVGDLGRVLDETGAGVVVDRPGDLNQLESAVRRLADAEFRSQLAHKALRAAPRFSVENCADSYAAVFLGAD